MIHDERKSVGLIGEGEIYVKGMTSLRTMAPSFVATAEPGAPWLVRVLLIERGRFLCNWFRKGRRIREQYWSAGVVLTLHKQGWQRLR